MAGRKRKGRARNVVIEDDIDAIIGRIAEAVPCSRAEVIRQCLRRGVRAVLEERRRALEEQRADVERRMEAMGAPPEAVEEERPHA